MASIRSFSDILLSEPDLEEERKQRFLAIIQGKYPPDTLARHLMNQMEKGSLTGSPF